MILFSILKLRDNFSPNIDLRWFLIPFFCWSVNISAEVISAITSPLFSVFIELYLSIIIGKKLILLLYVITLMKLDVKALYEWLDRIFTKQKRREPYVL